MDKTLHRARELRRNLTPPERRLWRALRARHFHGIKFRRQVPIGPYIADFVSRVDRLVIEIDGDTHAKTKRDDDARTAFLEAKRYRVVRLTNRDVLWNLEGVFLVLEIELGIQTLTQALSLKGEGEEV